MAASRRRAREQALQMLCLLDTQGELTPQQGIALYYGHLAEQEETSDDVRRYAEELVRGVRGALAHLDDLIGSSSRNWRLERMNWVDRNLLRLSAYELRHCPSVPAKVAINEAIEVAKRFGTGESGSFVNGILDRLLEETGRR